MRRSVVIAASTIVIATLGAGPAPAHDKLSGKKAAKAGSIQLRCRPEAASPASVLCSWSAPERGGTLRYELFRKALGSEGRPAVVLNGTERVYSDGDVVGGTLYAYKVTAVRVNGKSAARSRVVVVRCCDERPGRAAGEGKREPAEKRASKRGGRFEQDAAPEPGEGRKAGPDQRPSSEPSRLLLQCRATSENDTRAVACDWAGLPGDNVAGYRLYRKVAGRTPMLIATFPGGGTTRFIDDDVVPATTYWYAVEAKSFDGRGTRSNIVEVRCCP